MKLMKKFQVGSSPSVALLKKKFKTSQQLCVLKQSAAAMILVY
jgi:hypothetical protein